MKIVVVYNRHRSGGGSDVVAQGTIDLLSGLPDTEVVAFVRDSRELTGFSGKLKALISGCYAAEAVKDFSKLLDTEKPDLVHAHEIYPLISPWIFKVCRERRVPVVMTCHDYRMSCPIVTHYRDGALCHECPSHGESRCIRHNCTGSWPKSVAYAVRNYVGRKRKLFVDNVDCFLTPSETAKQILCRYSELSEESVIPVGNPVPELPLADTGFREGEYIAYAGRFEPEKGFDLLLEALAGSGLPLRAAGDASQYLATGKQIPDDVEFSGFLDRGSIGTFYQNARVVVVPSLWHETFGLVVAEALLCGTPVVVSDLGALAEVAGPGGLSVPAGDAGALRQALNRLFGDVDLCRQMAAAGREHVRKYSPRNYLASLLAVYGKVLGQSSE